MRGRVFGGDECVRGGRGTDARSPFPSILLAILASAVLVAVPLAVAQEAPQPDTEYTPVAKPTDMWKHVGGARWDNGKLAVGSPTPVEVSFYSVAFKNARLGFAGGARCETPPADGLDEAALDAYLDGCKRVPVIWAYSPLPGSASPEWHEVMRGDEKGFVGGIAFTADGRALAVGGAATPTGNGADGVYPIYEHDADEIDPAGEARAWTYDGQEWDPEPIRAADFPSAPNGTAHGLTAVDCSPRAPSLCMAGGFRQLYRWRGDRFDTAWSGGDSVAARNSSDLAGAARFRFRVRQVKFWPGKTRPGGNSPEALAVTSGCCADLATQPRPSVLAYDGRNWKVTAMRDDELTQAGVEGPRSLPDSYFGLRYGGATRSGNRPTMSIVASPGGFAGTDDAAAAATRTSHIFRVQTTEKGTLTGSNALVSHATILIGADDQHNVTGDLEREATDPRVSRIRLMAGDGDVAGRPGLRSQDDTAIKDGLIDWAVGEATGGDTGRAVAVTTLQRAADFPLPLRCETQVSSDVPRFAPKVNTNCPIDPDFASTTRSAMLFALDTHRLNAYDYVESAGVGWAVGERGAIQLLAGGTSSSGGASARPGKLGAKEMSAGPDIEPYRGFRPVMSTEPGLVPPLAAQPWEKLLRPEMRATGTSDPTLPGRAAPPATGNVVVPSRSGTEAFAFGEVAADFSPRRLNIDHFDGSRWRKCTPAAIPGVLDPDPACEGLAAVPATNGIVTAARVPLELDADPDNDDEFEIVAVAKGPADSPNSVLVYRDGRWSVDEKQSSQVAALNVRHLAMLGPDDGWLTTYTNEIYRFDGTDWTSCEPSRAAHCFDDPAAPVLPARDFGSSTGRFGLVTAGNRLYLFGARAFKDASGSSPTLFPLILHREPGGRWTAADGGFDPLGPAARTTPPPDSEQGEVAWLSVARRADGTYVGWAPGRYGKTLNLDGADERRALGQRESALLRLESVEGTHHWTRWTADDAAADYLHPRRGAYGNSQGERLPWMRVVALADGSAYIAPSIQPDASEFPLHPLLTFTGGRWKVLATPFHSTPHAGSLGGRTRALAADGAGGVWVAAQERTTVGRFNATTAYYRLGRDHHETVFQQAPHPVREPITSMAAGPDGTIWLSTASSTLYRYDRLGGWDRLQIKGWDPGKVVTRPSRANAVAVGPDGRGLVVGDGGRLANLSPKGVVLDAAAGLSCGPDQAKGCSTPQALRAAAIAPNGSALAGGDGQALLFRSGGDGEFGPVPSPPGSASASITSISFPRETEAWVANDDGQIYRGELEDGKWSWSLENVAADGTLLTAIDDGNQFAAVGDVELDRDGHGYAVGERGVILERTPGQARPWRRLQSGYLDNLRAVALPVAGGKGALISGDTGVILTLVDGRFEVAQPADPFHPAHGSTLRDNTSRAVGAALLPGSKPGEVEAWVATQIPPGARNPAPSALFHYASDPGDPLMNPARRARPLPDAPAPRPGEITFAAFGKSDCQIENSACPELSSTGLANAAVLEQITRELRERAGKTGGAAFALYTGDMAEEAGNAEGHARTTPLDTDLAHRRWRELVADPLADAGVPVFAAVGGQDLSNAGACGVGYRNHCPGTREAQSGLSTGWRATFADMPAPWGTADPAKGANGVTFEPVPGQAAADRQTDVGNPSDGTRLATLPTGGARTHYAFDMVRDGQKVMRVVVVDTSHQRSLSTSDADQNPKEPAGQRAFIERMLCSAGEGCTRPEGLPAVVLSNAPTYSFNPGALTDTQTDGAALETTLMQQRANLVVSGRLGWNAVYWATAPGLHVPCPGDSYRVAPPRPGERACDAAPTAGGAPEPPAEAPYTPGAAELAQALEGLGAPPPPVDLDGAAGNVTGVLPFVVASSAGGKLADDVTGRREGFWRGYSIVRMDPSGDPDLTIVEQRPVFDWIQLAGPDHVLKAGQKMRLIGEGREPMGVDQPARYVRIDSPSITHRYDLVLADPRRPYLPARDADGNYVELPPGVGSIDRDTGMVTADKGDHDRIFAIAILSVGGKAATYPLVFEPKRSFKPKPPRVLPTAPLRPVQQQLLRVAPPVQQPPPPIVLGATPAKLPPVPPAPPPAAPPASLSVELPAPPALPPIGSAPAAPGVAPPAPPAPPAPAAAPPPAALSLTVSAPGINVASQGSVIPPPAPPIQPAPPGGARKEARQRQAATAKSESSSDAQSQGESGGGGDGGGGGSQAFSRRPAERHPEVVVERHEFTAVRHSASEWSPWERGAVYGGGMTLAALLLSMTWTAAGPRARRKEPEAPAPAWARTRRWR